MTIDDLIAHIKASRQHSCLYHFTDESNLQSIDKKGLVSKERMRVEGWWPTTTGGDEISHGIDERKGLFNYVNLCFTDNHPMEYRAKEAGRLPSPRYLEISTQVLKIPEVRMADGVATASDTKIMDIQDAIDQIDIEVLYSRTDWKDPKMQARLQAAEKWEILVPSTVPRQLITKI